MRRFRSVAGVMVLLAPGARAADLRALFLPVLVREAAAAGLQPELADAVAMVETGYQPGAVGSSGEVGLMQVLPATALQLGFHGTPAELADPATNIRLGVRYLASAWGRSGGDICRTLTKYRAGLETEVTTPLSAVYCARAIAWLMDSGSRLSDAAAPVGMPMPPPVPDPHVAVFPPLPEQAGLLRPVLAISSAEPQPVQSLRRPRRMMADQASAVNARFLSHRRRALAATGRDAAKDATDGR